jgi:hypothetical protein
MCELMAFSATLNAETRRTCQEFFKRAGAQLPVQTDLYVYMHGRRAFMHDA